MATSGTVKAVWDVLREDVLTGGSHGAASLASYGQSARGSNGKSRFIRS